MPLETCRRPRLPTDSAEEPTKDIRLARRCQDEDSPNFREQYRYRAGVEATMSELDRRTGIKHLRIRGMKAVRFAAFMKAIGLNILRASRYQGGKTSPLAPFYALFLLLMKQWGCFKELIQERFTPTVPIGKIFLPTGSVPMEVAV